MSGFFWSANSAFYVCECFDIKAKNIILTGGIDLAVQVRTQRTYLCVMEFACVIW